MPGASHPREQLSDRLEIVMRVYSRNTPTSRMKGLINDRTRQQLNIQQGLALPAWLSAINNLRLPAGTEFSHRTAPYIAIWWPGRRSARDDREPDSLLNWRRACPPVGFKNGTDGNIRIASDAVKSRRIHTISGVTRADVSAIAHVGMRTPHLSAWGCGRTMMRQALSRPAELAPEASRRGHDRHQPRQQQQEAETSAGRSRHAPSSPRATHASWRHDREQSGRGPADVKAGVAPPRAGTSRRRIDWTTTEQVLNSWRPVALGETGSAAIRGRSPDGRHGRVLFRRLPEASSSATDALDLALEGASSRSLGCSDRSGSSRTHIAARAGGDRGA